MALNYTKNKRHERTRKIFKYTKKREYEHENTRTINDTKIH